MRKRTILLLLILTLSIYTLNINIQSAAKENNYRPTLLELTPHDPIEIRSDSDFEVFPGAGTEEDPHIIERYNITATISRGIYITDTTKFFIVRNCYIDAEGYGIYIDEVADGTTTVANNMCNNNNNYGIKLWYSDSSTVSNNTCSNNWVGIYLYYSGNSTISNNTCSNNDWNGIVLLSSGNSTITNNTCNNKWDGIVLSSSGNSIVANNTCSNNDWDGIVLSSSDFCVVTYNLIQENVYYGVILISNSDNNLIHHNTFVDNDLGGTSQAWDDGANNYWYDTATQKGNNWSDWSGTGSYAIDGEASSVDLYPLGEPAEHTTTEQTTVESTTDENQLSFTFTLLILVITLILTRIISKKTKKE